MQKDRRKGYIVPHLLEHIEVRLENSLLVGPSVGYSSIKAEGQELETMDFSDADSGFNQEWEDGTYF